jgi:hypothetical protein
MKYIKADTSTKVVIGPVVAVGDGFTPVTNLDVGTADEAEILKHDASAVTDISGNTFAAIASADGYYNLTLTAAQLDTEGRLTVLINDDSLCLPVRSDFMVVNANVYDSLFAAATTDYLQTDITQVSGAAEDIATATALATVDTVVDGIQTDLSNGTDGLGAIKTDTAAILADTGTDGVVIAAAQTVATVTDVTNQVSANITAISDDATAADNLEAQFDGTGIVGDNYPATQASVSNIANVGSAVSKPASSYTLTTGTQTAGTYASTEAFDGTAHIHTSTAGALDLYYEFKIGSGTPSSVTMHVYLTSSNDDLEVQAWDWVASSWVQIGSLLGKNAATYETDSYDLFVDMVGTGANEGTVRVRFTDGAYTLTSATLAVDQIFCSFNQGSEGYDNGAIWVDTTFSNTNTEVGIDGVARNPVSTIAAANTLLASTNLSRLEFSPGSSLTLSASQTSQFMHGHSWTMALGGQDINNTQIVDCNVTGIATAANKMEFYDCSIGTSSMQNAYYINCTFDGTVTWTLAGDYNVINCQSGVAGSGSPTFTKTAGQTVTAEFRRWSGGVTISGLEAGDVLTISGELGTVTLNGADATVEIRGTYKSLVNNLTGTPTVGLDGAVKGSDVADILVDTADIQPKIGTPAADVSADIAAVKAETALIVADTNELQSDDVPGLIAALNDVAATDIVSGGAITTSGGAVSNVTTVATTTTNSDMRGTDNAALASVATEARLAELDAANLPADVDTLLGRVTSTLFSGITSLAEWLGLMAGAQTANATALTEIKGTGAGSGTYDESTDSLEAIAGAGGGGAPTAVQIRQEMDSNSTQLAAIVEDTGTTLDNHLTDIKGTGFVKDTHSLIDIEAYVDVLDDATSGNVKIAQDAAAILVDTAEIGAAGAGLTEAGGTGDHLTALATAAALTTAQTDLDTITGTDGVTLATSQGNYSPSTTSEIAAVKENLDWALTVLVGALSNAGTATETYTFTIDGTAYTVTYAGLDADGNRGTTVLSKV